MTDRTERSLGGMVAGHRGELFHRIVGALRAGVHHVDAELGEFLQGHHFYIFLVISGAAVIYKPLSTSNARMEAASIRKKLRRAIGRGGDITVQVNAWNKLGHDSYIEIVAYIAVPT